MKLHRNVYNMHTIYIQYVYSLLYAMATISYVIILCNIVSCNMYVCIYIHNMNIVHSIAIDCNMYCIIVQRSGWDVKSRALSPLWLRCPVLDAAQVTIVLC